MARNMRGGADPRGTAPSRGPATHRRRLILLGAPGLESFALRRGAVHWSPRELHRLRPPRGEGGVLVLGDTGIAALTPPSLLREVPAPPWRILVCPILHRPESLFRWAPAHRSIQVISRALLGPKVEAALLEPTRLLLGPDGLERLSRCPCGTCSSRLHALEGLGRLEVGAWASAMGVPPKGLRAWARQHQEAHPEEVVRRYGEAVATEERAAGWPMESVAASLGYSSAESYRRARAQRRRRGLPGREL